MEEFGAYKDIWLLNNIIISKYCITGSYSHIPNEQKVGLGEINALAGRGKEERKKKKNLGEGAK